jgi:hypothetical protein
MRFDPAELLDLGGGAQLDSVIHVDCRAHLTHLRAQCALQRHRCSLEYRDIPADGTGRGGHFRANEAGADHHQALDALELRGEKPRLWQGPEVKHALQVATRQTQLPQLAACGDEELVVSHVLASVQSHGSLCRVQTRRSYAQT